MKLRSKKETLSEPEHETVEEDLNDLNASATPKKPRKKRERSYITVKRFEDYKCRICHASFTSTKDAIRHHNESHVVTVFKCDMCPMVLNKIMEFRRHLKSHGIQDEQIYSCNECDYQAKDKRYIRCHIIKKHMDEYNFTCDICGKAYKLNNEFQAHVRDHNVGKHMCDICGCFYPTKSAMIRHRNTRHINEYRFRCSICNLKLLSEKTLKAHMFRNHRKPIKCEICGFEFKKKSYLKRHIDRVHKEQKKNLCTICGKSFVCSSTLRIHYLTHTKARPYRCNVCGQTFTQRSSMMMHWRRKHPDAEEPPPPVLLTSLFETDPVHHFGDTALNSTLTGSSADYCSN